MNQQPTAKQYITTKARSLPISICLINAGWREQGMAQVMVARNHVTGNITGALFLVDLYCLGVKDVMYFFNEEADFMEERFNDSGILFEEIEYNLAHNIIYAGHDYALEYDIRPHKDFEIARYVLEEDDDRIPLIEIETGFEGKPMLVEYYPGQYSDARDMLEKHAGRDGYTYILEDQDEDDEDEDEEEDDDEQYDETEDFEGIRDLDIIPLGALNPFDAALLHDDVLQDKEMVQHREQYERSLIVIETTLRMIERSYEYTDIELPAWGIDDAARQLGEKIRAEVEASDDHIQDYPEGISEEQYMAETDMIDALSRRLGKDADMNAANLLKRIKADKHGDCPLYLCFAALFCLITPQPEDTLPTILEKLRNHRHMHLVALTQSYIHFFQAAITQEPWCNFQDKTTPAECFTGRTEFEDNERALFYALKTLQSARHKNMIALIANYRAMAQNESLFLETHLLPNLTIEVIDILEQFLDDQTDEGS